MEAAIRGIIISLSILKNTAPGIPVTKQNNNNTKSYKSALFEIKVVHRFAILSSKRAL